MTTTVDILAEKGEAVRRASRKLASLSADTKNRALSGIAGNLIAQRENILEANARDIEAGRSSGLSEALLDRLLLDTARLEGLARDVEKVAALPDPVGEVIDMQVLPNGLSAGRVRVPLGVIGAIYESRPNVSIDISALCLKSGNGCILRGGKESINSNRALTELVRSSIGEAGVPEDAVQFIDSTDRALVEGMLKLKQYIDLMIPRGGADFVRYVGEEAAMPVVTGGVGVCHTYVDRSADLEMAVNIAFNAKTQRPSVCNALDTLLVHSGVAATHLPAIAHRWSRAGVEMRCDSRALSILGPTQGSAVVPAGEGDWGQEYLDLIASVKVVDSLDEALEHIEKYGSGHSEAIVTGDYTSASRFMKEVDAAAVLVNASTRFVDGGQFGLGSEVGISTQKFHARGPLGLRELTSYKWIVQGNGQVLG
ncbi:MAG: glutamate-5-semialdehyde dehydrogenase [Dehalococcoidia bacterium]|nr:glutamate-5-semialdehyde dehydrogenase [Dehalococcoidia bacterium]